MIFAVLCRKVANAFLLHPLTGFIQFVIILFYYRFYSVRYYIILLQVLFSSLLLLYYIILLQVLFSSLLYYFITGFIQFVIKLFYYRFYSVCCPGCGGLVPAAAGRLSANGAAAVHGLAYSLNNRTCCQNPSASATAAAFATATGEIPVICFHIFHNKYFSFFFFIFFSYFFIFV